VRRLW